MFGDLYCINKGINSYKQYNYLDHLRVQSTKYQFFQKGNKITQYPHFYTSTSVFTSFIILHEDFISLYFVRKHFDYDFTMTFPGPFELKFGRLIYPYRLTWLLNRQTDELHAYNKPRVRFLAGAGVCLFIFVHVFVYFQLHATQKS